MLAGTASVQKVPRAGHNTEAQHRIASGTVVAAAPKNAVLGQSATNGRVTTGQGAPERRPEAQGCQRLMERRPGGASLHGDMGIGGVDIQDAVHAGHVEQDAVVTVREITRGVAHAPAPGNQGRAPVSTHLDQGLQIIGAGRPDDGAGGFAESEHVMGVEVEQFGVGLHGCRGQGLPKSIDHCVHLLFPHQRQKTKV